MSRGCSSDDEVLKVAREDLPVLILGAPGSGRCSLARELHEGSDRRDEPFRILNCRGGVREQQSADLDRLCTGLLREVGNGTLYLHGVGFLRPAERRQLFRILEAGSYLDTTTGAQEPVNCRIVASASDDPANPRLAGALYFRLAQRVLQT